MVSRTKPFGSVSEKKNHFFENIGVAMLEYEYCSRLWQDQ